MKQAEIGFTALKVGCSLALLTLLMP